jgi:hypothetical protein
MVYSEGMAAIGGDLRFFLWPSLVEGVDAAELISSWPKDALQLAHCDWLLCLEYHVQIHVISHLTTRDIPLLVASTTDSTV